MSVGIETVGGIDFGRCRCCGGRTSAERAKSGRPCFMCEQGYGKPRIRPGVRFRTVGGRTEVVVDREASERFAGMPGYWPGKDVPAESKIVRVAEEVGGE